MGVHTDIQLQTVTGKERDRGEREREVDGSARVDLENDH